MFSWEVRDSPNGPEGGCRNWGRLWSAQPNLGSNHSQVAMVAENYTYVIHEIVSACRTRFSGTHTVE